jgi:hypothetical protein
MRLCFWKVEDYPTFAQAIKGGGVREIRAIETECQTLFNTVGALANTIETVEITADLFDGNYTVRFVLFDDEGNFLDTM